MNISQRRLGVATRRLHARRLEQPPRNVRLVRLLTFLRERRGILPPCAILVLRRDQPVGGASHGCAILLAELGNAARETDEDLSGVEGHGYDGRLPDYASLKSTAVELDRHEPIEYRACAFTRHVVRLTRLSAQERRHDISTRLRIRRAPSRDETVVARDPAIAREGVVLCGAEPVECGGDSRARFRDREAATCACRAASRPSRPRGARDRRAPCGPCSVERRYQDSYIDESSPFRRSCVGWWAAVSLTGATLDAVSVWSKQIRRVNPQIRSGKRAGNFC